MSNDLSVSASVVGLTGYNYVKRPRVSASVVGFITPIIQFGAMGVSPVDFHLRTLID